MYSIRPNLILGFHGCDLSVVKKVINGEEPLQSSHNEYDWLGSGVYFWENDYERALDFAKEAKKRKGSGIRTPAVIGAVICLENCLDLTTQILD